MGRVGLRRRLLLAKAGLLDGYNVTTHWAFIPRLKKISRDQSG